ncbi:hypothetical protein C1H46_029699 [Malus baccata]|uniref:Uncharacterized protein n=1 Tax=Malus baccata TaxID=106549 RepID=A0A540LE70_MALBA|nr:hypothetical protein C1H46_029699 [Malus baccata]
MAATVSLLFLARSEEEEEEVSLKLSLTPEPWVSHVTRCTSVMLLEARRRHGGRRESNAFYLQPHFSLCFTL